MMTDTEILDYLQTGIDIRGGVYDVQIGDVVFTIGVTADNSLRKAMIAGIEVNKPLRVRQVTKVLQGGKA